MCNIYATEYVQKHLEWKNFVTMYWKLLQNDTIFYLKLPNLVLLYKIILVEMWTDAKCLLLYWTFTVFLE